MPDDSKKKALSTPRTFLVVDVSNSYTKLAPATGAKVGPLRTVPTPSLTLAAVRALAREYRAEAVFLGSVVPARTAVFRKAFGKRLHVLHGGAKPLGMPIRYPDKGRIG
ncbi:MAG TPA: hypothetical protein VIM58_08590, partial [Candidatus Methylacidiphilales bacterium]